MENEMLLEKLDRAEKEVAAGGGQESIVNLLIGYLEVTDNGFYSSCPEASANLDVFSERLVSLMNRAKAIDNSELQFWLTYVDFIRGTGKITPEYCEKMYREKGVLSALVVLFPMNRKNQQYKNDAKRLLENTDKDTLKGGYIYSVLEKIVSWNPHTNEF
jgi:hypothetical protein